MHHTGLFTALVIFSVSATALALQSTLETYQTQPQNFESSLKELDGMNQSMHKINNLLTTCQMKHECIINGLRDMARDHDKVAESMLEDFERQKR